MISIGILTYYAPKTLANTLQTYKNVGLFDQSDDVFVVIQYSGGQKEEETVCASFGVRSILLPDNGKMAWGFRKIYEYAKNEYILFLENDFVVCTTKEETDSFFSNCRYFLKDCNYDVVRGRSRNNAGEPNYAYLNLRNIPKENFVNNTHLSECIYWIDDPEEVYPTRIKRIQSLDGSGKWYTTTSRYCNYTNNPYACSKAFFAKAVLPYIEFGKDLERELTGAWSENQYTCVFGPGLFTHDRAYDGHN